jgi:acyl-CoA reductase-like NAD-dependent aldehyde dehydrogenase
MLDQTELDSDLLALHRVRVLQRNARKAAADLARLDESAAKAIAAKIGQAMMPRGEFYAEWELRETGYGRVQDKVAKHDAIVASALNDWNDVQLGGTRINEDEKCVEIAYPAGVIVAIVPSTTAVPAIIWKVMMAIMTRSAVIVSPHPATNDCSVAAVEEIAAVARAAGAPEHAVQILDGPTLPTTQALMKNPGCNLIMATGGNPLVRAAYSSGTPALGVGSGNVPVYVDESADLDLAAYCTVTDKEFEYGTPCSSPSVLFAHRAISGQLKEKMIAQGAQFLTPAETDTMREYAFGGGSLNPAIVGQSPAKVGKIAGLNVPDSTRAIYCPIPGKPDRSERLLKEKLSVICGFVEVDSLDDAIDIAGEMLSYAGNGHSCNVFTENAEQAVRFGGALTYNRIIVNTGVVVGALGDNNSLKGSAMIGTGFAGGSSVGHNVQPTDLIQWKKVVFATNPVDVPQAKVAAQPAPAATPDTLSDTVKNELRALLREELARNQ